MNRIILKFTAIVICLVGFAVFSGCKKDPNDGNKTKYAIGDYYKVNGVEGIVFEISDNGKHGKIISMNETQCEWAVTSSWTVTTYANNENDGLVNTNIINTNFDINEYPAFKWCIDKNSNNSIKWYFPAKNELITIYSLYDVLQGALSKYNGTLLSTSLYWSSTENTNATYTSWFINFSNGEAAVNTVKFDNRWTVRAVRTF